jgi:uncharacterized membrane protein YraQ (UPF0718 family)
MTKKTKKISGGLKFFGATCIAYFFLMLFEPALFNMAVSGTASMLVRIIPLLIFVFFIMVVVNLFVESGKIKKYLGESSGLRGWINAIIAGILVSGPPYVLYPLLKELKRNGMKDSLIAVFLYNRNVKIPFIPLMIIYFGLAYTIITSLLIIVFSILNGMLIARMTKEYNQ